MHCQTSPSKSVSNPNYHAGLFDRQDNWKSKQLKYNLNHEKVYQMDSIPINKDEVKHKNSLAMC